MTDKITKMYIEGREETEKQRDHFLCVPKSAEGASLTPAVP